MVSEHGKQTEFFTIRHFSCAEFGIPLNFINGDFYCIFHLQSSLFPCTLFTKELVSRAHSLDMFNVKSLGEVIPRK